MNAEKKWNFLSTGWMNVENRASLQNWRSNFSFSLSHLQFVLGIQFQFHCFYKLHSNLFLNFCCFCKQIYGQEALEYVPITLHECSALYFFLLFIYFVFCSFSLLDLWENLGKCSCIVPDLELKMLIRAYNLVFKLLASYFVPHYFILFF